MMYPSEAEFGFGSPDDAEAWNRVQHCVNGGTDMPILVNRGLGREKPNDLGQQTSHATDETGMREAYAMWKRMMIDGN
ncbi:hypothetical protein [Streptomyces sp. NBC_01373]|uniref:hypothetical protein n=1 Tax=Streptomyces sp. NBC_01373 TaxID=2903843 RepID=UPI002258D632|nr:hypothetical protein [Streptomyces sp. NBC_01373]MCX4706810.1 hypothetical protein [Streptomyces sp. NBC_01373]